MHEPQVVLPLSKRVLSFSVGESIFALPVESVREIRQVRNMTALPKSVVDKTIYGVVGLTALRGSVIPVFDGRVLFDIMDDDVYTLPNLYDQAQFLLLILDIATPDRADPRIIAIMIDAVLEVFDLHDDEILPPPKQNALDAVIGLIHNENEQMTLIVNANQLIDFNPNIS